MIYLLKKFNLTKSHLTEEKTEAGKAKWLAQGPSARKWQS